MTSNSALEAILKRDRVIVLAGLIGVTAVCWAYLIAMAAAMGDMPQSMGEAVAMTRVRVWSLTDFTLMFVMWVVMMIGMMVPSAAPMVLIFAMHNRRQQSQGRPFAPTTAFLAGYLVAWTGFSLLATLAQWGLDRAALLSPMMVGTSPLLGGVILIGAGVFQLTPLKNACLSHCRSPLQFIASHWRPGVAGALRMGVEHGAFCLGCCWILMLLLFVGGVMNLLWIAAITIFVLLEKALPWGLAVGRAAGAILILGGLFVVFHA